VAANANAVQLQALNLSYPVLANLGVLKWLQIPAVRLAMTDEDSPDLLQCPIVIVASGFCADRTCLLCKGRRKRLIVLIGIKATLNKSSQSIDFTSDQFCG
jgi:hypothetical protein